MAKGKLLAWWFEPASGVLGYNDGRQPRKGTTHKVKGQPVLCEYGLHASVNPLDALKYARSSRIWLVELGGVIVRGDDKATATERRYLWRLDAGDVLRAFARRCALDVIHLWDAPPVVVTFLKTGDESMRDAARDAAWGAAGDAAWDAARGAAWDAARDAAAAAWDAARAAARDAAGDAAAAAWDAARAAAWGAAGAAGDAALAVQSKRLRVMLNREAKRQGGTL